MRKLIRCLATGIALAAIAGPAGASVYNSTWQPGDGGAYSDHGGAIPWIESSFVTDSQDLSWYGTVGSPAGRYVVVQGVALRGFGTDLRSEATRSTDLPLTVYGYDGQNAGTRDQDGTRDDLIAPPVRIFASRHAFHTVQTDNLTDEHLGTSGVGKSGWLDLNGSTGLTNPVPEPASLLLLGGGLGLAGLIARRRRRA